MCNEVGSYWLVKAPPSRPGGMVGACLPLLFYQFFCVFRSFGLRVSVPKKDVKCPSWLLGSASAQLFKCEKHTHLILIIHNYQPQLLFGFILFFWWKGHLGFEGKFISIYTWKTVSIERKEQNTTCVIKQRKGRCTIFLDRLLSGQWFQRLPVRKKD